MEWSQFKREMGVEDSTEGVTQDFAPHAFVCLGPGLEGFHTCTLCIQESDLFEKKKNQPQFREHQKGVGLVGEMMSSGVVGLGALGGVWLWGREIRRGGRDMGVVLMQVVMETILRLGHQGRARGLAKGGPGYPGDDDI